MDSEIIKSFLTEAESYLPIVREAISAYQKSTSEIDAISTAHRHLHTIKGAALMIELPEISSLAKNIEDRLEVFAKQNSELDQETASNLFTEISSLETLISEAIAACGEMENSAESDFIDFSQEFDTSETDEQSFEAFESFESADSETTTEDFDLDEEMLEIFGLEAEDHLRNISAQLEILENQPNNREALMEIRRSSHTLKGAAGICGFTKISKLSHRMEDLLDILADKSIDGNTEIVSLLLASTEYLERLATGENSSELNEKIEKTYVGYSVILESLVEKPQVINAVAQTFEAVNILELSNIEDSIPPVSKIRRIDIDAEIEPLEEENTKKRERSVVRVSLERLDELAKLTGEMVLSRSIFELRIAELETQIRELQLTTSRLRSSTTRLESDFEAKSMSSSPLIFSSFSTSDQVISNKHFSDTSFDEFDALEFDNYTDFHQTTRQLIETASDSAAIGLELEASLSNLETVFNGQKRLTEEMQEKLRRLRMVPLSSFVSRLQRTVRVTADQEEKLADFVLEGENLEIDTQIVDALAEPLLHLLRNAVGHGIEKPEIRKSLGKTERGLIQMRAFLEGTNIVFKISDDGKGISVDTVKKTAIERGLISEVQANNLSDDDAINLIFVQGFSTADSVSQVSGRGVGMDIVKSSIMRSNGDISIESKLGEGTTVTIAIPVGLSVTRSLIVQSQDQKYAFPLSLVKQVVEVSESELEKAKAKGGLRLGNTTYSINFLNDLLGLPAANNYKGSQFKILLVETPRKSCALVVDEIQKPQELSIIRLERPLDKVRELLGASVLGDGSVLPVLDLIYLLKQKARNTKKATATVNTQVTVMIVDDSPSVRRVNSNLVTSNGWQSIIAKDGLEAIEIIQKLNILPDVILSDVEMPRMDGYELLASLKRQVAFKDIPIVMITSRASDKHRQKAISLGVSEYLTKPYDDANLVEIIKNLLVSV
jgi:chemosensory pili system protein ChpA (sensor histidine kinase/response regulator)